MRKVYGYIRSNGGDDSYYYQNDKLEKYAKNNNMLIEIFSDSNSGNIIGSQLQKLLNNIPSNSELIIANKNRISRNTNDYQLVMKSLKEKNIKVVILDEI